MQRRPFWKKHRRPDRAKRSRAGRVLRVVGLSLLVTALLFGAVVAIFNGVVMGATHGRILTVEQAASCREADTVIVLGAGVRADGSPTPMLRDRVLVGAELISAGFPGILLMSGDNQRPEYDEVSAMLTLAETAGVDATRMTGDRLGLSTYESLWRAKEYYNAEKVIIVTQKYHLYRAIYIARSLGMDAYGVAADRETYPGQGFRDVREIAARCKDLILTWFD